MTKIVATLAAAALCIALPIGSTAAQSITVIDADGYDYSIVPEYAAVYETRDLRLIVIQGSVDSKEDDGRTLHLYLALPSLSHRLAKLTHVGFLQEFNVFGYEKGGEVGIEQAEFEVANGALMLSAELRSDVREISEYNETGSATSMRVTLERVPLCRDASILEAITSDARHTFPALADWRIPQTQEGDSSIADCTKPVWVLDREAVSSLIKGLDDEEIGSIAISWTDENKAELRRGRASFEREGETVVIWGNFVGSKRGSPAEVVLSIMAILRGGELLGVTGFLSSDSGLCERWLSRPEQCPIEVVLTDQEVHVTGKCTLAVSSCGLNNCCWEENGRVGVEFHGMRAKEAAPLTSCDRDLFFRHSRITGEQGITNGEAPSCN